jgi:hypothetical protein
LADGIDPSEIKKAVKWARDALSENSFEVIAREWGAKNVNGWGDKNNRSKQMLEQGVFPKLGNKPITEIKPRDILICLQLIEAKGFIETAHRTLQVSG